LTIICLCMYNKTVCCQWHKPSLSSQCHWNWSTTFWAILLTE